MSPTLSSFSSGHGTGRYTYVDKNAFVALCLLVADDLFDLCPSGASKCVAESGVQTSLFVKRPRECLGRLARESQGLDIRSGDSRAHLARPEQFTQDRTLACRELDGRDRMTWQDETLQSVDAANENSRPRTSLVLFASL